MNSGDSGNNDKIPSQDVDYLGWLLSEQRIKSRNEIEITRSLAWNFLKSSWWRNFLSNSAKAEAKSIIQNIFTDFHLKKRKRPLQLYRYRPLQTPGIEDSQQVRIKQIFNEAKLWFSSVDSLNDPNEFQPNRGWQVNWHSPSLRDSLAIASDFLRNDYIANTRVCCFSESPSNMSLWSYYANSHHGVCLGFSTSSEWFDDCFPVRYVRSDPRLRPKHHLISNELVKRALIHKHVDWRNENEWRIVRSGESGLISFPSDILNEIIFGIRVQPADFFAIQQLIHTHSPQIRQYAAVPSPNGIKLTPLTRGPYSIASQFASHVMYAQPRISGKWKIHLGQRAE